MNFLTGHTDCGDLNRLLRDANINERGRLADILILDRSLLTTCCIILSHVSLEISDVGRLFYNDLIIFEFIACQVSAWFKRLTQDPAPIYILFVSVSAVLCQDPEGTIGTTNVTSARAFYQHPIGMVTP